MNVKQLLTNTLLVATLLIGGGSFAWAVDVASHNFNDQTTPFTIYDSQRIGARYHLQSGSETDYYVEYYCGNMNTVAFAYYNFANSVTDAATVTIDFDFYVSKVSGHLLISLADADNHTRSRAGFSDKSNTGYGSNGAIFNLGCYRSGSDQFAINNSQKTSLTSACLDKWCHATVTVNNVTRKVTYAITDSDGDAIEGASGTNVNFLNAKAQRCSQIDIYIGTNASGNAVQMDNLVITKTVSATSHTYSINAVAGGTTLSTIASGSVTDGSYFSTYIPKCLKYNNKYYVLDETSNANLNGYYAFYTMGNANTTKEINYTLDEEIIYYAEAEDMVKSGTYDGGTSYLNSKGHAYCTKALSGAYYKSALNLKYSVTADIEAGLYARKTTTATLQLINSSSDITDMGTQYVYQGQYETWAKTDQVIPAGSEFYVSNDNESNASKFALDYVIVRVDPVQIAISDCKYYETSSAFATYIDDLYDGGTLTTVTKVYEAHTAWQIAQAKANGSTDLTKLIRNAAVTSTDDWGGSRVITLNEQYTGAPDNIFIDANNQTLDANQTIYGVPAGTYTIKAATRAATGIPGTLYVNDGSSDIGKVNQITNVGNTGGDLGNGWSWSEMTFTLTETKDLLIGFWTNAAGGWAGCDDWHMTLGGVSATIGATGWTTFASPYALDLSSMTASTGEVKAYYASAVGGSSVTMTTTEAAIQAGEGIMLKGTPTATITIPIVTSGSAIDGNKLVGVTTNTTITKETENYANFFVLSNNDGTAEFQNLKNWLENKKSGSDTEYNTVTINAGKAYLDATGATGARLSIAFDDEMTGVQELKNSKIDGLQTGDCYNLRGQRVSQPTKGLYIVNGKKVIMK